MDEETVSGVLQQSVFVGEGDRVRVVRGGVVQGSLDVEGTLVIDPGGSVQGSVRVGEGAVLEVHGALMGSLHVAAGGLLDVQRGGRARGGLVNYGEVRVAGSFGGPVVGTEPDILPGGRRLIPKMRDGSDTHYYDE